MCRKMLRPPKTLSKHGPFNYRTRTTTNANIMSIELTSPENGETAASAPVLYFITSLTCDTDAVYTHQFLKYFFSINFITV